MARPRLMRPAWKRVSLFALPTIGFVCGMIAFDSIGALRQPGGEVLRWIVVGLTVMVPACLGESISRRRFGSGGLIIIGSLMMVVVAVLFVTHPWSESRSAGLYLAVAGVLVLLGAACGMVADTLRSQR